MQDKKRRFNVGDIVSLKGQNEHFEITEWFYECSYDETEGMYERSTFTMKGKKSGKYIDFIDEFDEDLKLEQKADGTLALPEPEKGESLEEEEEVLEEIFSLDFYSKPLTSEEIDFLLDKYNDYMGVHDLLTHMGFNESDYKEMAKQILQYLKAS
jgi:hypothetical protein